jgi:hypothetical protein
MAGRTSGGRGRSVTVHSAGSSTVWASKASPLATVSPISQRQRGLRGRPVGNSCRAGGRAIPIPSGSSPMSRTSRARGLPRGRVACWVTATVPAGVASAKQALEPRNSQPIGFPGRWPATSPPIASPGRPPLATSGATQATAIPSAATHSPRPAAQESAAPAADGHGPVRSSCHPHALLTASAPWELAPTSTQADLGRLRHNPGRLPAQRSALGPCRTFDSPRPRPSLRVRSPPPPGSPHTVPGSLRTPQQPFSRHPARPQASPIRT